MRIKASEALLKRILNGVEFKVVKINKISCLNRSDFEARFLLTSNHQYATCLVNPLKSIASLSYPDELGNSWLSKLKTERKKVCIYSPSP